MSRVFKFLVVLGISTFFIQTKSNWFLDYTSLFGDTLSTGVRIKKESGLTDSDQPGSAVREMNVDGTGKR